jgi:hypothetical protein
MSRLKVAWGESGIYLEKATRLWRMLLNSELNIDEAGHEE